MILRLVHQLSAGALVSPVRLKRRLEVHNASTIKHCSRFTDIGLVQVLGKI
jgi:hypothetical protein